MERPISIETKKIANKGVHKEIIVSGTVSTKNDTINMIAIKSIEVSMDYANSFMEQVEVDCIIGLGDVVHIIYPNRDRLDVTIRDSRGFSETYVAVIKNSGANTANFEMSHMSIETLNKAEPVVVTLACISPTGAVLRTKRVGGIFKKANPGEVLALLLKRALDESIVGMPNIKSVNMYRSDNKNTYDNIVIPQHINIAKLASYMQDNEYGIYNGNIGAYLNKVSVTETIHIAPLYHYQDDFDPRDILYLVSNNDPKTIHNESTYDTSDGFLKVLVGRTDGISDNGDREILSSGLHIEGADSRTLLHRPLDPTKMTKNISHVKITHKKTDMIHRTIHTEGTSNFFKLRSTVLKNTGIYITVTWRHSNRKLIKPFMPVVLVREINGVLSKQKGTLLSAYSTVDAPKRMENTLLALYITRD